jgi:hypothetical protein
MADLQIQSGVTQGVEPSHIGSSTAKTVKLPGTATSLNGINRKAEIAASALPREVSSLINSILNKIGEILSKFFGNKIEEHQITLLLKTPPNSKALRILGFSPKQTQALGGLADLMKERVELSLMIDDPHKMDLSRMLKMPVVKGHLETLGKKMFLDDGINFLNAINAYRALPENSEKAKEAFNAIMRDFVENDGVNLSDMNKNALRDLKDKHLDKRSLDRAAKDVEDMLRNNFAQAMGRGDKNYNDFSAALKKELGTA